jgi:hypothetical protein
LPIVVVVFNNGGIYRGDGVNRGKGADPSPTVLMKNARYDKLIEAFEIEITDYVSTVVANGGDEPLARQILREAWAQKSASPRSALVLAIAAAEVGFKQCVSQLVPEARWLVEEIPSHRRPAPVSIAGLVSELGQQLLADPSLSTVVESPRWNRRVPWLSIRRRSDVSR